MTRSARKKHAQHRAVALSAIEAAKRDRQVQHGKILARVAGHASARQIAELMRQMLSD